MSTITSKCPHCGTGNRVPVARIDDGPTCGQCSRPLLAGAPVALGDADFAAVIGATRRPVVVDFWAAWCGPCRGFAPVFAAAAAAHPEWLFAKVDTDANPALSQQFGIRSIPTLGLWRDGALVQRVSGALPGAQLEQWLAAGVQQAA